MKILIDDEEMKIIVSDCFIRPRFDLDNKSLGDFIVEHTKEKYNIYRNLFGVSKLEKITFEIYDIDTEKDKWQEKYVKRYGHNPPEYSNGYFESDGNISSCCMHANACYGTAWWYSAVCTSAHEAFHLYYQRYGYHNDRIVWFDEGMAQFLSGEADYWLNDEEKFQKKWQYFINNYHPISNLNERCQGNNSVSNDNIFQRTGVFDGYLASILIIKYLHDRYGEFYLKNLMKDNEKIREIGSHILEEMISYYKKQYDILYNNMVR